MNKPKIFCFSSVVGGGKGVAYAMAEDGIILESHFCSNEDYVSIDLGVDEGSRPDLHKHYAAYYQDGYEMEFVRANQIQDHEGLKKAFALNKERSTMVNNMLSGNTRQ